MFLRLPWVAPALVVLIGHLGCSGCEDRIDDDVPIVDDGSRDAEWDASAGDADTTGGPNDTSDLLDTGAFSDTDSGSSDTDTGDTGDTGDPNGPPDASDAGGADADADADADGDGDIGGDAPPQGLSEPCQNGPGWTVFRFYYDSGSNSARVPVWDASCAYLNTPTSACHVRPVAATGDVARTGDGFPIVTTSDFIRVRFSVEDLDFSDATLHIEGHGFFSVVWTEYRVWSPLYGEQVSEPFDNQLQWISLDWSDMLTPDDDPGLTAIQIYANLNTHDVAVRGAELCVE